VDREEKRRLKKIGKQIVADRSQQLHERLLEANPAPVGSDSWASNYREATLKERALRAAPPNRLTCAELRAGYVTVPTHQEMPAELLGVPGLFWECLECGEVVNSLPNITVMCTCGNVLINIDAGERLFRDSGRARPVKLLAKGFKSATEKKPWWRFWR
jgi:hypothetical protein